MPRESNSGRRPVIGITMDLVEAGGRLKADCSMAYAACVSEAGGTPVMLPPIHALIGEHLAMCDGFVFTGGDDPKMEDFGVPTHPAAKLIHPDRQRYELALLKALESDRPDAPVLGVCLGMQLQCLHAGGRLNQHLPDSLASHARHIKAEHIVIPRERSDLLGGCGRGGGTVWSNHRQAIDDPGRMEVIALSDDGVIEATRQSGRKWYVGVQWHPERTRETDLGAGLFAKLVTACRGPTGR